MHRSAITLLLLALVPAESPAQVIAEANEVMVDGVLVRLYPSSSPRFAGNGRYVAFTAPSPGDGTEILWVKDLTTPRGVISQTRLHMEPVFAISHDARYVAFLSDDEGLVSGKTNRCWHSIGRNSYGLEPCYDLFIGEIATGKVTRVHGPEERQIDADAGSRLQFSADGRWIVYQRSRSTQPGVPDSQVLLYDREHATTTLVSGGMFACCGSVSNDGARVAFVAVLNAGTGTTTQTVMVYDRLTGTAERVDDGNRQASFEARISANGRYVAYDGWCSTCPTISANHVVVRDLVWKRTFEPIVGFDGRPPDFGARIQEISADGRYLLLDSSSTNLVEGARGGNVFVFDRVTGRTSHVSRGANGTQPNGVSFNASMVNGGGRVAFLSQADSIAPHVTDNLGGHLYIASLDLDNDGLYDDWERFFDDSPLLTGPLFDDDGDGVSNLDEFLDGTHPRGRFGLALSTPAESGAWGIKLHNDTGRIARIMFRLTDALGNSLTKVIEVPALSSTPIRLDAFPNRPQSDFTLDVHTDEPLFGLPRLGRQ